MITEGAHSTEQTGETVMRYTTLDAAVRAMESLNRSRSHAPAAVYWCDSYHGYYTVIRAWSHHNRDGLFLTVA